MRMPQINDILCVSGGFKFKRVCMCGNRKTFWPSLAPLFRRFFQSVQGRRNDVTSYCQKKIPFPIEPRDHRDLRRGRCFNSMD